MTKKKESLLAGYMSNEEAEQDMPAQKPPQKEKPQKVKKVKEKKQKPIKNPESVKPKKEKKVKESLFSDDEIQIKSKLKKLRQKLVLIFFIALSLYMGFLIIGIVSSTYVYNDEGEIVLKKMSVDDIREEKEYSSVLLYYVQMKELYEEVIILDYELEQGPENYILLASEYETLTNKTEEIFKGLNALTVSRKYDNILAMMKQWIYEDMPVYLQNISGAISENDSYKAEQAILGQSVVNSNFSLITNNIVGIGKTLDYDVSEYEQWSVEKFREEKIGIGQ